MEKLHLTKIQIIIEFALLLLFGLFFCLLLSLISYDPADPSWSQTSANNVINNWCGGIGAYIADICLQFFGFIAFMLPIFAIIACVKQMIYFYRFKYKTINYFKLSFRIIGFLGFTFSATAFFSINIADHDAYQAGGNIGYIIAMVLLPAIDHVSASFLLLVIAFACITLITDLSWLDLLEKLGGLAMLLTSQLVGLFSNFFRSQRNRKAVKRKTIHEREFDIPLYNRPYQSLGDEQQSDIQSDFIMKNPKHRTHLSASEDEKDFTTQNASELLSSISQELNTNPASADSKKPLVDHLPIIEPFFDKQAGDEKIRNGQLNHLEEANDPISKDYTFREYVMNDLSIRDPIIPFEDEGNSALPSQNSENNDNGKKNSPHDELESTANSVNSAITNQPQPVDSDHHSHLVNDRADDTDKISNVTEPTQIDNEQNDNDQNDSLIHPLLVRNEPPLNKPTTPLPSLDLLTPPPMKKIDVDHDALGVMSELIEQSLADYRVKTKVVDYQQGPVITRFEIEPAPGIKAARISTLDRDLARSLSMSSVRVVEVIPGKPYVGIELPNENRQTVYFREVLDSSQFRESPSPLTIVLGKDISGQSVVADLAKMPHVLVAGTTGSGKSVGVNAMILSILYKSQPEDVRFIMIDPKMLELSVYEGIPHLLTPVVTDMKDAANALNWCVNEMERRYRLMSALGVRNIAGYNDKIKQASDMGRPIPDPLWKPADSMDLNIPELEKLPYIVVLVDEFADLIMAVGKKVEELIARLAQKARAAGIHLVLATQRPSVDVITGLIKANIPTRIAFTVSSKIDSRTILDQMGAESLLGMGDMLYLAPNSSIPVRVHGAFVRDEEVHAVVQDWKARGGMPKYIDNITVATDDSESNGDDNITEELDPLFDQVVAFVIDTQRASISGVQRKFRIGYNRAARIVEQMENEGIVSSPSHNGNREVLAKSHS